MRNGSRILVVTLLSLAGVWTGPVWAQTDSVTIDDQPTTEQNLARINALRRASRHDDAADLLQELVDGARFKLVRVDAGLYIDAELWARRELSRDPALLRAYRDRYTASGERAMAVALEDGGMVPLREAYRRFGMTRPGLEAGLVLTGRLLESGDTASATSLVEELYRHPDRQASNARVLYLRGVCAALRGDDAFVQDISDRLRQTDAAWADRLAKLRASVSIPAGGVAGGLIDAGPEPEGLDVPLWDTPIESSQGPGRPQFDGLRSMPVVAGERVLINSTQQVLALDRASGQPLWAYPPEVGRGVGFEMNLPAWQDTRGVAVSGRRVFAVLGACRGVQGRGGAEVVPSNLLVCLDPTNGEVMWSRPSGEIAEDEPVLQSGSRGKRGALLQTHFVGTPVSAQGQVFSLVRKTSLTGIQTTWLASFDANDGRLRWFRHIALVQVHRGSDASLITPQILLAGDTLYVTDQIAVAASLDVHSGAYRWLRVLADDRSRQGNQLSLQTDGVSSPPVLTPAGLVVQLALNSQHRLFLLDPASGRLLREMHDDRRMSEAQYLLDASGNVVIVSKSYAVFWDGESGEVRWVHAFAADTEPRGLGAATRQFVVIPTQLGLTTLRLSDGEVIAKVPGRSGNVTAMGTEMLVATNGFVRSYMSWEGAYARLIERVQRRPEDPGPGLSLAALALERGEGDETVLEGIGLAMQALGRIPVALSGGDRQQVFDRIREMAGPDSASGQVLRAQLYDRLAETAVTAEQTVAYHLDLGQHLTERGDPEQAVGHFQAVMVDPALASVGYAEAGGSASGPAGAAAQRELLALVREHGQAVYHRYDALAKQELELLLSRGDPAPAQLARIAKRYPFAVSAAEALLIAAERLETSGQPIGALSQYQQALSSAITDTQRRTAAEALLGYYERSRRPDEALALLDRMRRTGDGILPHRLGQAMSYDAWRSVFDLINEGPAAGPHLAANLGRPIILPGQLLLPPPGMASDALQSGLFIYTPAGALARFDAARNGESVWATPIKGQQHYVLADDQGQVLVWSVDTQTLQALDSQSGAAIWEVAADLSSLDDVGPRRRLPDELPWVRVGPSVVCFIGRSGRVIGVDRFDGTLRWISDTGIPRVTAVAADPWTLVVAGVVGPELDLNHGKLVLLDQYTGTPVLDRVDMHVGFMPQVVGMGRGSLLAVAEQGADVAVFDAITGESRWHRSLSDAGATPFGLCHGGVLTIQDQSGMVHVLGFEPDQNVVARLRLATDAKRPGVVMHALGEGMLLQGPNGVAALREDGSVSWRTADQPGGGAIHQALAGAERVAIIASTNASGDPDLLLAPGQAAVYRLDLVGRMGGSLEQSYTLGPIQGQLDPRRAVITGGGIAIAMGRDTLLIPSAEAARTDGEDEPAQQ